MYFCILLVIKLFPSSVTSGLGRPPFNTTQYKTSLTVYIRKHSNIKYLAVERATVHVCPAALAELGVPGPAPVLAPDPAVLLTPRLATVALCGPLAVVVLETLALPGLGPRTPQPLRREGIQHPIGNAIWSCYRQTVDPREQTNPRLWVQVSKHTWHWRALVGHSPLKQKPGSPRSSSHRSPFFRKRSAGHSPDSPVHCAVVSQVRGRDSVWHVWGHLLREVALAGGQAAGRAARIDSAVGAARPTAALRVNLELTGDGGAAGVGLTVLLHSTVVCCAGGRQPGSDVSLIQ